VEPTLENLNEIERKVRAVLWHGLDAHVIALDIWTECWTRGTEPLWITIRHRVIDAVRAAHREVSLDELELDVPDVEPPTETPEERYGPFVSDLVRCAKLSILGRKLLVLRFYVGLSPEVIASGLDMSPIEVNLKLKLVIETLRNTVLEALKGTNNGPEMEVLRTRLEASGALKSQRSV
jgi:hypothetical protein